MIIPSYRYPNGWFVGQGSKRIGYLTVLATASMSAICQMTDFKGGVSTVKKSKLKVGQELATSIIPPVRSREFGRRCGLAGR